jgi:hypothetical protein
MRCEINLHAYARPLPYRMTYERAGVMFRAMMLDISACSQVSIYDIERMGLRLPEADLSFAAFLDENADRLQCYDEPVSAHAREICCDDTHGIAITAWRQELDK